MTDADEVPEDGHSANVSEDDFNGTATFTVVATGRRAAKAAAKRYFREVHGSRPTNAVAEKDDRVGRPRMEANEDRYTVRVSDHSSGSLADSKVYDFDPPDDDS